MYQNDSKHIKNINFLQKKILNFYKKKLIFLETRVDCVSKCSRIKALLQHWSLCIQWLLYHRHEQLLPGNPQ